MPFEGKQGDVFRSHIDGEERALKGVVFTRQMDIMIYTRVLGRCTAAVSFCLKSSLVVLNCI